MKQLDSKAVWLFFITLLFSVLPAVIMIGFISLPILSSNQVSFYQYRSIFSWWPLALIILFVVLWIWAKLSYKFYRYELRSDGFRKESGVIWKRYTTIPYSRIQNVDIYRGVVARMLGLSDLHIQTAGTTMARNGISPEGRLPGLSRDEAERLRDELVKRARTASKDQGL